MNNCYFFNSRLSELFHLYFNEPSIKYSDLRFEMFHTDRVRYHKAPERVVRTTINYDYKKKKNHIMITVLSVTMTCTDQVPLVYDVSGRGGKKVSIVESLTSRKSCDVSRVRYIAAIVKVSGQYSLGFTVLAINHEITIIFTYVR